MKVKPDKITIKNKEDKIIEPINVNNCFSDSEELQTEYYKGIKAVAEFCGKIDALVASGFSIGEAKEVVFVLTTIEEEKNKTEIL